VSLDIKPLVGKGKGSVALATAPGNLWVGAVRSSKTICSIIRWLQYMRKGPPGPVAMIGRTERTLKRNVLDTIQQMVGHNRFKVMAGSGEANFLGRKIYLAGADNELAVSRIQGMTLSGFYGDEIPTWPPDVFKMARTRCSVTDSMWFGTGNPAGSSHWLMTGVIERAMMELTLEGEVIHRSGDGTVEVRVFHFGLDDNPNLDPDYVRRLKTEYTGVFYLRFILGKWVMAEGAVYPMWDEKTHVIPDSALPVMDRWIGTGTDHGQANPYHAVLMGQGPDIRRPGENALYVTHELRHDSRATMIEHSDLEYSQMYRKWLAGIGVQPEYHFVDPSAKGYRVQLYRDGVNSWPADNDVMQGISTVASALGAGKLYVAKRCVELRKEFPNYAYDDKAAAAGGVDKVIKVRDHGVDAVRYDAHTSVDLWHGDVYGYEHV
jgi:PBSX family phage terminase large subunit